MVYGNGVTDEGKKGREDAISQFLSAASAKEKADAFKELEKKGVLAPSQGDLVKQIEIVRNSRVDNGSKPA